MHVIAFFVLFLHATSAAFKYTAIGRWGDVTWTPPSGGKLPPPSVLHVNAMPFTTPIGDNYVYTILKNNTISAWDWKQRGTFNWTSTALPGIAQSGPVLTTDQGVSDVFYILNPSDSRIYAFDPLKRKAPLWTSVVTCTGGTPYQRMGLKGSSLVVRCGPDLLVLNTATGKQKKIIRGRAMPAGAPVPFITNTTIAAWKDNLLFGLNVDSTGPLMQFLTALPAPANITGVAAGPRSSLITLDGSNTVHVIDSAGKLRSSATIAAPGGGDDVLYPEVLPTPRVDAFGIAYGILVVKRLDFTATTPLQPYYSTFALNISNPANATLVWASPLEPGTPGPQHVVLTNKFACITDRPGKVFTCYNRTDGTALWGYSRYPGGQIGINVHGATYNDYMMVMAWDMDSNSLNRTAPINEAYLGCFTLVLNGKVPAMRRRQLLGAQAGAVHGSGDSSSRSSGALSRDAGIMKAAVKSGPQQDVPRCLEMQRLNPGNRC